MQTETLIQARLSSPTQAVDIRNGTMPADIQWMPPGEHTITALKGNEKKPTELTVKVDEALSRTVANILQGLRAKAASGTGDLPFFDFNHDDAEASGHPTEFYWGGADPLTGGIRAKLEWTDAGKQALAGKTYRRFSPTFHATDQGEIFGLGVNLGGLVNKAAFRTIQPIWSRDGAAQLGPTPSSKPQNKPMPKTTEEQLADLSASVASLTNTVNGLATSFTTIQAKLGEPTGKILVLETQIAALNEAGKVTAKATAEAKVQDAVKAGKLPAQDTALQGKWVELITIDAKNGTLLDGLPSNPALQTVVTSGGSGSRSAAAGEHVFLVKAKAYAESNKIASLVDAQSQFAGTIEGSQLYNQYVESFRG